MITARYDGTTVARSDATERVEGNHYFPRDAVAMDRLEPSPTAYTCPWKGETQYYHLVVDGERIEDAAWSYPDPKPEARHIAGHVAFDPRKGVAIEEAAGAG